MKNLDMKYWGNRLPICPYCDFEIDLSRFDLYELYNEGDHHIDCPHCERKISIISRCNWSFDTDEQDEPDESKQTD